MRRRSSTAGRLAPLAALAVLAGCSSDAPGTAPSPPSVPGATTALPATTTALPTTTTAAVTVAHGPLLVAPAGDGGLDALIIGTLALPANCLGVVSGEPPAFRVVLWPQGTTWDAVAATVVLPGGTRVAVGADIELRGGGVDVGSLVLFQNGGAEMQAAVVACNGAGPDVWYGGA